MSYRRHLSVVAAVLLAVALRQERFAAGRALGLAHAIAGVWAGVVHGAGRSAPGHRGGLMDALSDVLKAVRLTGAIFFDVQSDQIDGVLPQGDERHDGQ